MTLSDDTITETAVPSLGEMSADSQTNQGPHTQSINFKKYLEDLENALKPHGIVCYLLTEEKTLLTEGGKTWAPDFVAIHEKTGIVVAVGECLTTQAGWGKYSIAKKKFRYNQASQPANAQLGYSNPTGQFRMKSYCFDSLQAVILENGLFKPFFFFIHGVRSVDTSPKRVQETTAYVANKMPEIMLTRHGVDAISSNLYKQGENTGETKIFGKSRMELRDLLVEFSTSSIKGFDKNTKTLSSGFGGVYSKQEHKEILKQLKGQRDIELDNREIKSKGSARDWEAGIWIFGMKHPEEVLSLVQENSFQVLKEKGIIK